MRRLELGFDTKVTNRESLRAVVEDVRNLTKEAAAAEVKLKGLLSNKQGTQAAPFQIFSKQMDRELADIDRQLTQIEESFSRSTVAASGFNNVLKGIAVTAIATGAEELARYAARTETLAVVTDQLSKVNGINVQATRQQVDAVKALGITTQESLSTINRMIFANLDLRRSTDLARVAQDAAVIANKNSSEALDGLVLGITTRNARVLRTYGIVVDFEREYKKVAQEYGRELTNTEKTQVAFNTVLEKGTQIQGSYEASMLTTGKQLTSLSRQFDEAKNSIGNGFVPILGAAVRELSAMAGWLERNGDAVSTFATTAATAGIGARVGSFFGPWGTAAGAVLGGAAGMYLAPTEEGNIIPSAQAGLQSINRRRAELERMMGRTTDPKEQERIQKQLSEGIPQAMDTLKAAVADAYAQVLIKATKDTPLGKNQIGTAYGIAKEKYGEGIEISPGVKVRTVDIGQAIYDRLSPVSTSGPMVNRAAISQDQQEELARQAAEKAKKAQEKLDQTLSKFADVAVSELQRLYMDLDEAEKAASILGPKATSKLRSVAGDAAFRIVDKQVEKDYQKKASDAMFSRESTNYAMRLSGMDLDPSQRLVLTERGIGKAFQASPVGLGAGVAEQYMGRAAGDQAKLTRDRERDYEILQRMGDLEARRAELAGDQVAGLVRSLQIKNQMLDIEQKLGGLGKTQFDLDMERLRIREETEIRVLEIRKQQKEQTKEEAGRFFDAMTAGGAGITDYFSGMMKLNTRKIFQNAAGELFGGMSGKFQLPGQTNKDGSLNIFGKILQGTIGGVDPAKQLENATSQNTKETATNNQLLQRLNDLMRRAQGLPAEAGIGSVASTVGSLIPSGVLQGSVGAISPIFSLIDKSISSKSAKVLPGWSGSAADAAVAREMAAGMPAGTAININDNARGAGFAKGVGYAATVASGGMAVYSGIKQGGTQGYMNAASAALGTAAALDPEPISKGVLMAAAALTQVFSGVFGISEGDRRKRASEIDNTLKSAQYKAPEQLDKEIDAASGGSLDTNMRGDIRVYQTFEISAVDAKSFIDYKEPILDMVSQGVVEGGRLREEIRNVAAVSGA